MIVRDKDFGTYSPPYTLAPMSEDEVSADFAAKINQVLNSTRVDSPQANQHPYWKRQLFAIDGQHTEVEYTTSFLTVVRRGLIGRERLQELALAAIGEYGYRQDAAIVHTSPFSGRHNELWRDIEIHPSLIHLWLAFELQFDRFLESNKVKVHSSQLSVIDSHVYPAGLAVYQMQKALFGQAALTA